MKESLFYFFLFLLGWFLASSLFDSEQRWMKSALAFPLGCFLWVASGTCLIAFHGPLFFGLLVVTSCFLMILLSQRILSSLRQNFKKMFLVQKKDLFFILTAAVVCLAASYLRWSALSDDSVMILLLSKIMARDHFISATSVSQLSGFGIFLPLMQANAFWFGYEYLSGFSVMMAFSFVLSVCVLFDSFSRLFLRKKPHGLSWLIVALLLLSSFFLHFEFIYIHNNLIATVYFQFFLASILFYLFDSYKTQWLWLTGLTAVGYFLTRNEAPVMILPGLFLLLSSASGNIFHKRNLFGMILGVTVLWHLCIYGLLKEAGQISQSHLTPMIMFLMDIPLLLMFCFSIPLLWKRAQPVLQWVNSHVAGLSVLLILIIAFFDWHVIDVGLKAIVFNFLGLGGWGLTWIFLIPALLGARWFDDFPNGRFLGNLVLVYLIEVLLIGIGQGYYRVGWGDSANRNVTHIFGLAVIYLVLVLEKSKGSRSKKQKRPLN